MLFRFTDILFVIIVTITIISCAVVPQENSSVFTYKETEVRSVDVDSSNLVLYASLLDHPHMFEPAILEAVMGLLYFTPVETEPWSNKRPIFPEKNIQVAAPLIQKAFLKAKPYQKIQFRIQTEKGFTTGDTFILDGALHWIFQLIEDTPQFDEFYNVFEFGGETSWPTNWVLVLQEGQQFYGSKLVPYLADKTFWVVMDLPPSPSKSTALQPQGIPPETENQSLMERLGLLRELKNEGLISEEDFQGKLRTLVDEENATVPDSKDRLRFLKELRDKGAISEGEYKNKVHEILEVL